MLKGKGKGKSKSKSKSKESLLIGRLCVALGGILAYITLVVLLMASLEPSDFDIELLVFTVRSTSWDDASPWAILQPLLLIGALAVSPCMANCAFYAIFHKKRICRRVELKTAKRTWILQQQKKCESAKKCGEQKKSIVRAWLVRGTFYVFSIAAFNATIYGLGLINDGSNRTASPIFRFTALIVVLVTLHLFGHRLKAVSTFYMRTTVIVVGELTRVLQRLSCGLISYETKGVVSVVKGISCKKRKGEKKDGPDGTTATNCLEEKEKGGLDGTAATHSPEEMV